MADYPDNMIKQDWKYVHAALSAVDSQIVVPDSVRGAALRHKLDNVQPDADAVRSSFRPRLFSLQSGLTYAAAFMLIVALFYGMGVNKSDIISSGIPIDENAEAATPQSFAIAADDAAEALPETAQGDTDAGPAAFSPAAAEIAPATTEQENPGTQGVGGSSKAVTLGTQGNLTFAYRTNDSTDPDKGSFPLTLDIVDNASGTLAGQIDVPDMLSIVSYFPLDNTLTLIGVAENSVITRTYDISSPENPVEMAAISQPGAYLDATQYKGIVRTVTQSSEIPDAEAVVLPNSVTDNSIVISAVDTVQAATAQMAFVGADGSDVSLHNLNVYIKYDGKESDDAPVEDFIAQVRLDGMNMELGAVS